MTTTKNNLHSDKHLLQLSQVLVAILLLLTLLGACKRTQPPASTARPSNCLENTVADSHTYSNTNIGAAPYEAPHPSVLSVRDVSNRLLELMSSLAMATNMLVTRPGTSVDITNILNQPLSTWDTQAVDIIVDRLSLYSGTNFTDLLPTDIASFVDSINLYGNAVRQTPSEWREDIYQYLVDRVTRLDNSYLSNYLLFELANSIVVGNNDQALKCAAIYESRMEMNVGYEPEIATRVRNVMFNALAADGRFADVQALHDKWHAEMERYPDENWQDIQLNACKAALMRNSTLAMLSWAAERSDAIKNDTTAQKDQRDIADALSTQLHKRKSYSSYYK